MIRALRDRLRLRAGGGGTRRRGDDLIDRDPQHLPLPIGGFSVVRKRRRPSRLRRWWRHNATGALTGVGLGAAALGAWLASSRPPTPVYGYGNTIHAGSSVLVADPGGSPARTVYRGGAVVVIADLPGGGMRGTAVTLVRGREITGRCDLVKPTATGVTENCVFVLNPGQTLVARDELDVNRGPVWHRHYGDGIDVAIAVPADGAVVPVPFAIGR